MAKVRCQRMGCDAMFSEDDNPEDSCRYHDAPLFHDGMKEWSCCKQRSHDFTLFLDIPGCKTGRHTTEKPPKAAAVRKTCSSSPAVIAASATNKSVKETCSRCLQGFFFSDHGSRVKDSVNASEAAAQTEINKDRQDGPSAPAKKIIDINQPRTCKNKGCGQTIKERDNHETACSYHPGPAIFHDRIKGWKCCDIHAKEFDEFMTIPPCTKGWHNAD